MMRKPNDIQDPVIAALNVVVTVVGVLAFLLPGARFTARLPFVTTKPRTGPKKRRRVLKMVLLMIIIFMPAVALALLDISVMESR